MPRKRHILDGLLGDALIAALVTVIVWAALGAFAGLL